MTALLLTLTALAWEGLDGSDAGPHGARFDGHTTGWRVEWGESLTPRRRCAA